MRKKLTSYILFFIIFSGTFILVSFGQPGPEPDKPSVDPKPADANDKDKIDDEPTITSPIRTAINKGLRYISTRQNSKGSFGGSVDIAKTSLAGLALVAGGHPPNRGEYSKITKGIVKFLINSQGKDTGYFHGKSDGSRIHGHGYAALFMSQVMGMISDEDLQDSVKSSVEKATRLSASSQTEYGGWGYVPDYQTWDEGSTTVTQIQSLRTARDAGIKVSRRTINRAIEYVHKCAMRTDYTGQDGKNHIGYTFKYSLHMGGTRATFPLTAAAASVLLGSGIYEGEVLEGAIGWMKNYFMRSNGGISSSNWYSRFFYYTHFYASQVFWHSPNPKDWKMYYPKISKILVDRQNSNGSWPSSYGDVYGTAIACLILAIPDRFLPLFQK